MSMRVTWPYCIWTPISRWFSKDRLRVFGLLLMALD